MKEKETSEDRIEFKGIREKKKYFIIGGISLALIIVSIIVVVLLYNKNLPVQNIDINTLPEPQEFTTVSSNGTQTNTSETLAKTRQYAGLDITSVKLTATAKSTIFIAEFKNNTSEEVKGHTVKLTMLNKEGNEIVTINGYLGTTKPGETYTMYVSSSNGEFINSYDYTIAKA